MRKSGASCKKHACEASLEGLESQQLRVAPTQDNHKRMNRMRTGAVDTFWHHLLVKCAERDDWWHQEGSEQADGWTKFLEEAGEMSKSQCGGKKGKIDGERRSWRRDEGFEQNWKEGDPDDLKKRQTVIVERQRLTRWIPRTGVQIIGEHADHKLAEGRVEKCFA